MRPAGSGRFFVRGMSLSLSRSMYMLSAFAPATMSDVPRSVDTMVAVESASTPGIRRERKSPPAAVMRTMNVIRGFASVTRSRKATWPGRRLLSATAAISAGFCMELRG